MARRCLPRCGPAVSSPLAVAVLAAKVPGYRTAPLTAVRLFLAVQHLVKIFIIRVGAALHRQEGASDRPLPVSISGDGCTDRGSVTDRDESCVTGFHHVGSTLQQQSSRLSSSWESGSSRAGFEGSHAQMGCTGESTAIPAETTLCRRRPHWISKPSGQQVHQQSVRRLHCGGYRAPAQIVGVRGRSAGGGGSTRRSSSVVAMHLARTSRCAVRAVPRSSAVVQAVPRWCTSTRRAGGLGRRGAIRLLWVTGVQGRVARATGGGASSQHLNVAWRRRWSRGSAFLHRGQPRATMAICTTSRLQQQRQQQRLPSQASSPLFAATLPAAPTSITPATLAGRRG